MDKQKNIPTLRFPEFTEVWENQQLGDLTKINQGLQIPISERYTELVENSYFYITNEFLKEGSTKKYFIKNPSESVKCVEDDILMTRTGNTGQVVTGVNGAFHNNFFKIKYSDRCDKWFLFYFLNLNNTQKTILRIAGTSTIPDLNHSDFYRITIIFPSKPEQTKIATFLTAVDERLNQLKKKKTLLEQYKKGVMQKIFDQEIRFKDDDGNEFPDWEERTLNQLVKISYGKDQKQVIDENGQYPILGTGGIIGRTNKFLYNKPSVLIGRKGTIDKPVYMDTPFWTVDTLFYTEAFENTTPKWLYYKFQTINWYLYNEASGVPSLSGSTIYKIEINLPCLVEQTKIANFLTAIDEKLNLVNNQINKTEQYKKGLLQKMFC